MCYDIDENLLAIFFHMSFSVNTKCLRRCIPSPTNICWVVASLGTVLLALECSLCLVLFTKEMRGDFEYTFRHVRGGCCCRKCIVKMQNLETFYLSMIGIFVLF